MFFTNKIIKFEKNQKQSRFLRQNNKRGPGLYTSGNWNVAMIAWTIWLSRVRGSRLLPDTSELSILALTKWRFR